MNKNFDTIVITMDNYHDILTKATAKAAKPERILSTAAAILLPFTGVSTLISCIGVRKKGARIAKIAAEIYMDYLMDNSDDYIVAWFEDRNMIQVSDKKSMELIKTYNF